MYISLGMTLTEDSILEEEIEETRENSLKNPPNNSLADRRRKSISSGESWGSEEGRTYREAHTNRQQSDSIREAAKIMITFSQKITSFLN